jgi:N-acetyl-anhydromuramyl-L-alanine amidase AmpD
MEENHMQINHVGMTRKHYQDGEISRIRMVVLHATAGHAPGDYNWLRQGGSSNAPVSVHYYIDKQGTISQFVEDANIAWHAGRSTWVVDGQRIDYNHGCNGVSLGIELENLNDGRDPYPRAQYDATVWLTRSLVQKYNIPRAQVARHLDIAPRRKTDPRGFPWERFVAKVFAAAAAPQHPADDAASTELPDAEAPAPLDQLRDRLIDLAYRAAGSSCPARWPLLREAVSRQSGMPVAAITPEVVVDSPQNHPDQKARSMNLPGLAPLVLEAYGRDLFYAPPDCLEEISRLSTTPDGVLRDALLQTLFSAVDPANGYQPGWAFHRFYLEHMEETGVPISPNYRLPTTTSDGQSYACQHFALDSLCSPVGQWKTIIRLSELNAEMENGNHLSAPMRELRTLLLNNLYQRRTGRTFDPSALFCRYALSHNLGAPLGKAEYIHIAGQRLAAMPFALDVIYCRVPEDGNWGGIKVGDLPDMLGSSEPQIERLSTLLHSSLLAEAEEDTPDEEMLGTTRNHGGALPALAIQTEALLGGAAEAPALLDLSEHFDIGAPRSVERPDMVVAYSTDGPASHDLAGGSDAEAPRWHYYVDRGGGIVRLADEQHMARAIVGQPRKEAHETLDNRSIAVGVEGGTPLLSPNQRESLDWLVRNLSHRFNLKREQVLATRALRQRITPEAATPVAPPSLARQKVGAGEEQPAFPPAWG